MSTPFPTASHRKTQTDMRMFTHAHMCVYTHEDMSAHLSMTLVIAFCNMCIIAGVRPDVLCHASRVRVEAFL